MRRKALKKIRAAHPFFQRLTMHPRDYALYTQLHLTDTSTVNLFLNGTYLACCFNCSNKA